MRKPVTNKEKVLYLLLAGLLFGLLGEVIFRITSGPRWINPYYLEISSDFTELAALIEDSHNTPELRYYDEFLYAATPYSSRHINFTDYYSARLTPDSVPLAQAEHIVWTFGGSTMENTETTDNLTIANTWAKIFNNALGPTHVKNFGTGGFFSSYELIKFQKLLREVPENELPTMAIFYDGYNDAQYGFQYGPGSLQKDLSLKVQALVEHNNFSTSIYALSRELSQHSRLWDRTAARLVEYSLFPLPEPNASSARLDKTVRIYTSNVKMIQATCQVFEIKCFFVLQPLIMTKDPLGEVGQEVFDNLETHPRFGSEGIYFMREFYDRVSQELSDNEYFIDASDILDGRKKSDFYDPGHVGAESPPVIGEKIANLILARLQGN